MDHATDSVAVTWGTLGLTWRWLLCGLPAEGYTVLPTAWPTVCKPTCKTLCPSAHLIAAVPESIVPNPQTQPRLREHSPDSASQGLAQDLLFPGALDNSPTKRHKPEPCIQGRQCLAMSSCLYSFLAETKFLNLRSLFNPMSKMKAKMPTYLKDCWDPRWEGTVETVRIVLGTFAVASLPQAFLPQTFRCITNWP